MKTNGTSVELNTRCSINHSSSVDTLTTSAMVAFVTPGHDDGLCHDHHWARDIAAERRAFPRVADPALLIASMMDRIRAVVPNAKLAYNNSPSFNWTLNFRQQVHDAWVENGNDVAAYERATLMSVQYDDTALATEADQRIRTFQADAAKRAGIFHHLITLPTYHTEALAADNLAKEYFGAEGMRGYVKGVQRQEIRQGVACVRHQNMAGSDIGDDHKEHFAGAAALKAGGSHNTMNRF